MVAVILFSTRSLLLVPCSRPVSISKLQAICDYSFVLSLSLGNDDTEEVLLFPDADPYLSEVQVFLAAVRSGDRSLVRSSYRDAANTYRLSWDIRRASEIKLS